MPFSDVILSPSAMTVTSSAAAKHMFYEPPTLRPLTFNEWTIVSPYTLAESIIGLFITQSMHMGIFFLHAHVILKLCLSE
jgi:hypothetical protein